MLRENKVTSRVCGFRETISGRPCKNLVEDGHDHCAAGHPVAVLTSVAPSLRSRSSETLEKSFDIEELLASMEVLGQEHAAMEAEFTEGKGIEGELTSALDCGFEYTETIEGESANGHRFSMSLFASPGEPPDILGWGTASAAEKRNRWFYVTTCDEPHAEGDAGQWVFWGLSSKTWYGKEAFVAVQDRRDEFFAEIEDIRAETVDGAGSLCSLHGGYGN